MVVAHDSVLRHCVSQTGQPPAQAADRPPAIAHPPRAAHRLTACRSPPARCTPPARPASARPPPARCTSPARRPPIAARPPGSPPPAPPARPPVALMRCLQRSGGLQTEATTRSCKASLLMSCNRRSPNLGKRRNRAFQQEGAKGKPTKPLQHRKIPPCTPATRRRTTAKKTQNQPAKTQRKGNMKET